MRFNIEDYPGNYAMHCKTFIEAKSFLAYLNGVGRTWNGGGSYIGREQWRNNHQEKTCYAFNEGRYTNKEWYEDNGYIVLEWSDFMYDTPAGRIDETNDYDLNLVTICGIDWFKLPEENGAIPIVAKDAIWYTTFQYTSPRTNNFAQSELLERLQSDLLPRMEAELGADNIVEFETDLTSVYDETDCGVLRSRIAIPTWSMYKKHLKAFRKYTRTGDCFWSATPWTINNSNEVCVISGHTYVGPETPRNSYNVRPVLYIKASALTTQN